MRRKLIILMIIAASLGGSFFILSLALGVNFFNFANYSPNYALNKQKPKLSIGETEVFVDIARTSSEKQKGLSGRESLGDNEGMLFIWDEPTTPGFWMKDMNFAIDIIWIINGEVVGFEENVEPEPVKTDYELARYYPPEPITHVLEVNAGFVNEYGLAVGDEVGPFN